MPASTAAPSSPRATRWRGCRCSELDDGRFLAESRAICTYLEGLHPEPNLMGRPPKERAFIEMADRQVEFHLLATIANFVRHTHPGLLALENPQFPDFGHGPRKKMLEYAALFDARLASQPWMAGDRLHDRRTSRPFCGIEFARLVKFQAGRCRSDPSCGMARPGGRAAERPRLKYRWMGAASASSSTSRGRQERQRDDRRADEPGQHYDAKPR